MDNSQKKRNVARKRRVMRVRKNIRGTSEIPRLSVSRTNKHLYAQLIDDEKGLSIAGIGTQSKENKQSEANRKSRPAAREIGKQIANLAKNNNIQRVVFDRGVSKYHGVIAELADGAREAGLQF